MYIKKIIAGISVFILMAAVAACKKNTAPDEDLSPPVPKECDDPNAVTFDNGDISFAEPQLSDPDSAQGELSVESVMGNNMLKFTDSGTNFADGNVQKIIFDAAKLLDADSLPKVRSLELDVYADATADDFVNDDGKNIKAPGWIGGGGGANVSGDKWYDFSDWEGGEYNFEMSGAVHVEMKFLLANSGKCWDEDMEEAVFMIMRWGSQNEGNFYIDNIVFYDENGNSLPLKNDITTTETTEGNL